MAAGAGLPAAAATNLLCHFVFRRPPRDAPPAPPDDNMGDEAPAVAGAEEWRHMWGARVGVADMPDDILKFSIEVAHKLLDPIEDWQADGDEAVQAFKKEMDEAWTPHWHVIVGKNFGSQVTHEARCMAYFYVEEKAVLVFKSG